MCTLTKVNGVERVRDGRGRSGEHDGSGRSADGSGYSLTSALHGGSQVDRAGGGWG